MLFERKKTDFETQRKSMVEKQIEGRGIGNQKVLGSLLKIERHRFVPPHLKTVAYEDRPLPIGYGQTISQPYIVAFMTELLELKEQDSVLEIGTGSGYQTAVLAEIAEKVYSIEVIPELSERAKNLIEGLGYRNVYIKIGDGWRGWKEYAPFSAIIVTCAPTKIPPLLIEQLSDGGKMVVPIGSGFQKLKLVEKVKGEIKIKNAGDVSFVPMIKKEDKR